LRTLLIGGGHAAYFVANAIRESDIGGKLVIIEFTREKVEVLSKTFPSAEVIVQSIDEVEQYIRGNSVVLDAVIAATESDALNLRYSKIALQNSIPLVIAVLNNPLNTEIFKKEGIKYIVNPYSLIPVKIKEILGITKANILYEFTSKDLMICMVKINDENDVRKIKKKLVKSSLSYLFETVDGEVKPSIDNLSKGGTLYIMGRKESVKKILKRIPGVDVK